jgi:VanZ family protein
MIPASPVSPLRTSARALVRWGPLLLWMALIFWMSAQPVVPHPGRAVGLSDHLVDYTAHAAFFGVLALWAWWALGDTGLAPGRRLGAAGGLALLYALSDEAHQALVPGRYATLPDLLADAAGIAGAVLFLWLLTRRR